MNHLSTFSVLLADIDRFQAMRGSLRPDKTVDYTNQLSLILVILAVIVAVTVAVRYFNKWRQRDCYHPHGLFRELSRVHELDRAQVRLLREVATGLHLEHPSRLFLEPNLFEQLLREPQFAKWQQDERRSHVEALQRQLFDETPSAEQAIRL